MRCAPHFFVMLAWVTAIANAIPVYNINDNVYVIEYVFPGNHSFETNVFPIYSTTTSGAALINASLITAQHERTFTQVWRVPPHGFRRISCNTHEASVFVSISEADMLGGTLRKFVSLALGKRMLPIKSANSGTIVMMFVTTGKDMCDGVHGRLQVLHSAWEWHSSRCIPVASSVSILPVNFVEMHNSKSSPQPFTPSTALLASGLHSSTSKCAAVTAEFVNCVQAHGDAGLCRQQQKAYMDCQRSLFGFDEHTEHVTTQEQQVVDGHSQSRFTSAAVKSSIVANLGTAAIQKVAVETGLSVEDAVALCAALRDSDCPVQTMTSVPLPVASAPGRMGMFGPDLSGVAGLVIGAILNGIIGPQIIEMGQTFFAKIVTDVPPVLRKVLVDGVDVLSAIPPMPKIPDPREIMEQVMAQVAAAKAIALANLERAKAALAMAKATAEAELAKAQAFKAQMQGVYGALRQEAMNQLASQEKAWLNDLQGIKDRAKAMQADMKSQLQAAKDAADSAISQAKALGHIPASITDSLSLRAWLKDPTTSAEQKALLQNVTNALDAASELQSREIQLEHDINTELRVRTSAIVKERTQLQANASKMLSSIGDTAPFVPTSTQNGGGHTDGTADSNVTTASVNVGATTGVKLQLPTRQELLAAQSSWVQLQRQAMEHLQRARAQADALKAAQTAVIRAEEDERLALEESEEVRKIIAEQEKLSQDRLRRNNASVPDGMRFHSQQEQAEHTSSSQDGVTAAAAQTGEKQRRGLLAIILHYELSHGLTTALTLSTTRSFHDGLVKQLHDALLTPVRDRLDDALPGKIADTVAAALEAATSQTVPPLLERMLPALVMNSIIHTTSAKLVRDVGVAVVDAVSHALLNPPEVQLCCQQCQLSGEHRSCVCCSARAVVDARREHVIRRKVVDYAEFYTSAALAHALQ